ncbi:MAG: PIG-L family deacetylase [Acetobacteraceae bacterium]|nr:PIG-L family deacetylase [Acetobacteraceae bacterium]
MAGVLVVTAHPGDFVWRAGGAIALHASRGDAVHIVCMSYGERGESQGEWAKPGATLEGVKSARHREAEAAAKALGATIEFYDAGDYPLMPTPAMTDRLVDTFRAMRPDVVLTHPDEDPYNLDHPTANRFAQAARIIAQAAGHKPGPDAVYRAPQVYMFEPHQTEMCRFRPDVLLDISAVWETKQAAFRCLPAQTHLWHYYERVALNRGQQAARNSGRKCTHAEAYQRVFPEMLDALR